MVACLSFVWLKRKRRKQARAPNGFTRSESSMQSYSKDLELGGSPHIFTYEELEEATDGFSDSKELGDGGFGTVYKGWNNVCQNPSSILTLQYASHFFFCINM